MAKGAPKASRGGAILNLPRQRSLLLESLLLGVVGAVSAGFFQWLLDAGQHLLLEGLAGFHPGAPPHWPGGLWLVPVATTLGGLVAGFLVYTFCPEAEGHGTDSLVKAYHRQEGVLRGRVPIIKALASAITIGSGGSAGREGPTALIAGGVGSLMATWGNRPARDRRLLMLVGAAAGLAAIFRSPVGAAFFAVEVLYFTMEVEAQALLYCMLASVVAYAVNGQIFGWEPLFYVSGNLDVHSLGDYGLFALLGVVAGAVGTTVPPVFYGVRDAFRALRLPNHVKPALGGLALGLMVAGLGTPEVLGGGYETIQKAIDGSLGLHLLVALLVLKLVALSLTISSGGSGGVFAPALFLGAMLGGIFADVFVRPSAPFVVVGMAALFAGSARVPLATMLMLSEMTDGYQLLVPAALAVLLSFATQGWLSRGLKYKSLYEAQVEDRAASPAHVEDALIQATRILGRAGVALPPGTRRFDIAGALTAGVILDLPGGWRLRLVDSAPVGPPAPVDGTVRLLLRSGNLEPLPMDYGPETGDRFLVLEMPEEKTPPGVVSPLGMEE